MKIIHLSDLHLKKKSWANYKDTLYNFKKICINIKKNFKPDECVVVITGDLVDSALDDKNYELVTDILNDDQYLKGYTVLVVPGNHDYGPGFNLEKGNYFHNFKKIFFQDREDWESSEFYPKVDIVVQNNARVAFIGMDSMEGEIADGSYRNSDGQFGSKQLKRLSNKLNEVKDCDHIVLYFHHHAYSCRWESLHFLGLKHGLKDREALGKVIKDYHNDPTKCRIKMLLYGHGHFFEKDSLWGIIDCYDAGSSTRKKSILDYFILILQKFKKTEVRVFDLVTKKRTTYNWL